MSRKDLPNKRNSFEKDIKIDEQDKSYKLSNLQFRIDQETGKICIFTSESENFREDLPGVRAKFTEKSVSSGHIIYSTFSTLSGHTYELVYHNKKDEERYGKICYYRDILTQIFGFYDDKYYTLQELRVLEFQINILKENARYIRVSCVKYDDSYTWKKLLEGLHIANGWINTQHGERRDFICLEKQYLILELIKTLL